MVQTKAKRAASPANAAHVTATVVTVASVVDAASAANAVMRQPHLAQHKAKKARKSSTWCALLTLPSQLQHLRRRQRNRPRKWLRPHPPWQRTLPLLKPLL